MWYNLAAKQRGEMETKPSHPLITWIERFEIEDKREEPEEPARGPTMMKKHIYEVFSVLDDKVVRTEPTKKSER